MVNGFHQSLGIDYFDTLSPVIKPSAIRIIFTLVATDNWEIQQVDINDTFLNGELNELLCDFDV